MVTGAYFPEISGAGLQCRQLVRALATSVDFSVLTTTTDPDLPECDERDGVPVYRVFIDPHRWRSKTRAALRMTRIVVRERRRYSIVHLHGFSRKSMLLVVLGLLMRKRIAIKLTSVGHDDPIAMRARGRLTYWCYSRADVFFGVSPRLERLYGASGLPRTKFRLIPNGVDLQRFQPASSSERRDLRRELSLPVDSPIVLFVGFFSSEKCPDVLFDAWARLAAAGDASSVVVFVGATRGVYYELDERLARDIRERGARLGLAHRMFFVESTPAIEKYHRAADIFVLPSVREGLPGALLEAMACGTACVATRLAGVTDTLIEDGATGILVEPRDVAGLETTLEALVSDPEHARMMGARARDHVARGYAMSVVAAQYLTSYQELASPSTRGRSPRSETAI